MSEVLGRRILPPRYARSFTEETIANRQSCCPCCGRRIAKAHRISGRRMCRPCDEHSPRQRGALCPLIDAPRPSSRAELEALLDAQAAKTTDDRPVACSCRCGCAQTTQGFRLCGRCWRERKDHGAAEHLRRVRGGTR